eukprot:TRINITY_DN68171_c8_g6_i1.p1 TRINITY_DN68171_c8_g6~~TRINITY_DN68171_c8_g6_i1.p1  ORF type:complete len:540 (-),score=34.24 TRINITY_DN68171_c8_g6_i1:282-1901(-)
MHSSFFLILVVLGLSNATLLDLLHVDQPVPEEDPQPRPRSPLRCPLHVDTSPYVLPENLNCPASAKYGIIFGPGSLEINCKGRTIRRPFPSQGSIGIGNVGGNGVIVRNCTIENWGIGINCNNSFSCEVSNSKIRGGYTGLNNERMSIPTTTVTNSSFYNISGDAIYQNSNVKPPLGASIQISGSSFGDIGGYMFKGRQLQSFILNNVDAFTGMRSGGNGILVTDSPGLSYPSITNSRFVGSDTGAPNSTITLQTGDRYTFKQSSFVGYTLNLPGAVFAQYLNTSFVNCQFNSNCSDSTFADVSFHGGQINLLYCNRENSVSAYGRNVNISNVAAYFNVRTLNFKETIVRSSSITARGGDAISTFIELSRWNQMGGNFTVLNVTEFQLGNSKLTNMDSFSIAMVQGGSYIGNVELSFANTTGYKGVQLHSGSKYSAASMDITGYFNITTHAYPCVTVNRVSFGYKSNMRCKVTGGHMSPHSYCARFFDKSYYHGNFTCTHGMAPVPKNRLCCSVDEPRGAFGSLIYIANANSTCPASCM